jgi:CRP-like cAMP-binding protein
MHPDPDRLSDVPLFQGLSEEERGHVAEWLDDEHHKAGKWLAREGSSDYAFFVLSEGSARVEHEGKTLRVLEPGDVFGEIAFFGDGRRSADVIAETDVRVLCMFGTRFREMQASMPDVAGRLEDLVRQRADLPADD